MAPRPLVLRSIRFNELLGSVLSHLEQAMGGATVTKTFWLKSGHPAYPVYWDFAVVVAGPGGAEV